MVFVGLVSDVISHIVTVCVLGMSNLLQYFGFLFYRYLRLFLLDEIWQRFFWNNYRLLNLLLFINQRLLDNHRLLWVAISQVDFEICLQQLLLQHIAKNLVLSLNLQFLLDGFVDDGASFLQIHQLVTKVFVLKVTPCIRIHVLVLIHLFNLVYLVNLNKISHFLVHHFPLQQLNASFFGISAWVSLHLQVIKIHERFSFLQLVA